MKLSNFNNKTITAKGLELLSKALSGSTLEFTKVVMGDGAYDGDIGLIESLVSQKQILDIKSITRKGSQIVLSTTLLQSAIINDFYWKEVGVYAKGIDNVEVLYMYGSATETSYITKDMLNEKLINIGVLVSNATNIAATINNSLVYLSKMDLEEHNNDTNAHQPIRLWVQKLFESLKLTWANILDKPNTFPPPVATTSVLGGVKQGSNTSIAADGTISVVAPYVHPQSKQCTYAYTHPTGDGNLHVPATGAANSGKVLMAGAAAESPYWGQLPSDADTVDGIHVSVSATTPTPMALNHVWIKI